ncbi:hypothetical protein GCM10008014_08490 [Paenibacillus silvae]|uniref:Phage protein n=1 Tax=Paenibacillus silvae TaxID=1325358 RepID=A0ABQ1Z115_9BACL|nr:hypothetical protein [Paenibacillus silvae]GGH46071.1 hypothetical protein GCM10008014_08490 [Paenibacillus silvae]
MKLIDADKLLYDLANEDVPPEVHSWVLDAIDQGKYEPDIKPGDTVIVTNETQFSFLKFKLQVNNIQWHRGGWYASLEFENELYTIPLSRCQKVSESIPKEGTSSDG